MFSASERDFGAYHIIEGRGEVNINYSLGDMVTMAQTMDADVIILGEIKGEEARQFLAAAHTGAICYASTHAESVEDAYIRLCDYTRRISDMTDEEILYMLKSLKNVIFIKNISCVRWQNAAGIRKRNVLILPTCTGTERRLLNEYHFINITVHGFRRHCTGGFCCF